MRPFLLFSLSLILLGFNPETEASEPTELLPSEREAQLQAESQRLETQLNKSRQTIAGLESELESVKNEVTAIQQASPAGEPY